MVLDSPELTPEDPVAFRREAMLSFVVALAVVEVKSGELASKRLGVFVTAPTVHSALIGG